MTGRRDFNEAEKALRFFLQGLADSRRLSFAEVNLLLAEVLRSRLLTEVKCEGAVDAGLVDR